MRNPFEASVSVIPAASAHTAPASLGGLLTFQNMGDPGDLVKIVQASLRINGGTIETTAWTLHLYNAQPDAVADAAAWDLSSANDLAAYQGSIALSQVVDLGTTLFIEMTGLAKYVKLAAGSSTLYGYLVNGTTLTPQAVAHIIRLISESVRG